MGIQWRERDPANAASGEVLDRLNLLIAIVFAQRALPKDLRLNAFAIELLLRLQRARVDGLPELVGRSFRNDGDRILLCKSSRTQQDQKHERKDAGEARSHGRNIEVPPQPQQDC